MTQKDIIRIAREAGFKNIDEMILVDGWEISPFLQRFATLAAAAEREACAKVADQFSVPMCESSADAIAFAIRARGNQ